MRKAGLAVEGDKRITVVYDGQTVGEFSADMMVEGVVIVENKATQTPNPAHEVQRVNYLTATGIESGLLLNFGGDRLQFKRKHRTYRPKETNSEQKILP